MRGSMGFVVCLDVVYANIVSVENAALADTSISIRYSIVELVACGFQNTCPRDSEQSNTQSNLVSNKEAVRPGYGHGARALKTA